MSANGSDVKDVIRVVSRNADFGVGLKTTRVAFVLNLEVRSVVSTSRWKLKFRSRPVTKLKLWSLSPRFCLM